MLAGGCSITSAGLFVAGEEVVERIRTVAPDRIDAVNFSSRPAAGHQRRGRFILLAAAEDSDAIDVSGVDCSAETADVTAWLTTHE